MQIVYFKVETLYTEFDLKQEYKRLAIKHHPDKGGNEEIFKAILNEYDYLLKNINKISHIKADSCGSYNDFMASISDEVAKMYNVLKELKILFELEIIGDWLWVTCDKNDKDIFKELGFKFSPQKKMWYWKEYEFKYRGKSMDIDEIRSKYDSMKVIKKNYIA